MSQSSLKRSWNLSTQKVSQTKLETLDIVNITDIFYYLSTADETSKINKNRTSQSVNAPSLLQFKITFLMRGRCQVITEIVCKIANKRHLGCNCINCSLAPNISRKVG